MTNNMNTQSKGREALVLTEVEGQAFVTAYGHGVLDPHHHSHHF